MITADIARLAEFGFTGDVEVQAKAKWDTMDADQQTALWVGVYGYGHPPANWDEMTVGQLGTMVKCLLIPSYTS